MSSTLLAIGFIGILGLSVLCPLLAWPVYLLQRMKTHAGPAPSEAAAGPAQIEIIIPAYNESEHIGVTLTGIVQSMASLQAVPSARPRPKITVHVGTDGCSDDTAAVARRFAFATVTEFAQKRSKWDTLKTLIAGSSADWVILVDAGTLWPENFLTNFLQELDRHPQAVAVAPAHRPREAGWLHRGVWWIEVTLKGLETFCGGPISLHGATVGYKTAALKKVYAHLGETRWMNDDIVIPLMLRALYPECLIVYPAGNVSDAGLRTNQLDVGRRKRMLVGNLQWVIALLPQCFRRNPPAAMVAVRRLFRVLWAYWLAFVVIGLSLAFHMIVLPLIASAGILIAFSGSFRQLAGAALVSLEAPFQIMHLQNATEGSWK